MRFARHGALSLPSDRPLRLPRALAEAHGSRRGWAKDSARARFAAQRFHRTVELVGACVMMAAFLMLALFA